MRYINTENIEVNLLELREYVDVLANIIREWRTSPISADVTSYDHIKRYNALWSIGTRFVPIAEREDELSLEVSLDELDVYYNVRGNGVRVYENVVDMVAKDVPTPLVKLKSLSNSRVQVWAKLEWYHPFSLSIKDRVAWYMFINALKRGHIKPGDRVYEPTSTNTGLGLVGIANYYGVKTRVYLPVTAQKCMDYLFTAMGAEVVRKATHITTSMVNAVILEATREGAVVLNQFENDLNFIVHLKYTAKELDYQLRSLGVKPDVIVGGIGTSGHLSAISFYFKNRYGNVRVYGVQPDENSTIPGIRRVETGMKWIDFAHLDGVLDVTQEEAFQGILQLARGDGLLVGFSGGASIHALKRLIEERLIEGVAVVVIPDHGVKYIELMQSLLAKTCPDAPYSG